jgi:hypothetical protein
VFSRPEIKGLLNQYVLLRLYTDGVPDYIKPSDSAADNKALLSDHYKTTALPYYVIIRPTAGGFETVDEYDEGKINSPERFADFLKRNLPKKAEAE